MGEEMSKLDVRKCAKNGRTWYEVHPDQDDESLAGKLAAAPEMYEALMTECWANNENMGCLNRKGECEACKTGGPTTCNFDYSGALTEAALLCNVALRTGKKITWDPIKLKAVDCPEADKFIKREYRDGWWL